MAEKSNTASNTTTSQQSTMIKWPWWKKFAIGSGEFGEGACNAMFTSFFSIYCTDVVSIGAGIVSLIIWISKIWDAINDIIIGILADRTRTKLGRYRPWIISSAVPFVIITVLLFANNPEWSEAVRVLYAVLTYCTFTWVYTMFYIPYISLQATLTQDPNERASIGSIRVALAVLASWLVGSLAPGMMTKFQASMSVGASYTVVALIFSLIGFPFILLSGIVSKEYIKPAGYDEAVRQKTKREKIPWGKMFGMMKTNKYLVMVIVGSLVGTMFMNGRNTAIMYYFTYRMENLALVPIFITLLRLPMIIGNFTSQFFVRVTGSKGKVVSWSYIICAIACILASLVDTMDNLVPFFAISAVLHFFMGVAYAQSNVIISDTVEYSEYLTGERMEGFTSSFVSFFSKIGIAVGVSLVPLVLAITGYVPNVTQTPTVITGIMTCMYYMPAVLALIAGITFLRYKLDNKRMGEIVAVLQERRAAKEKGE